MPGRVHAAELNGTQLQSRGCSQSIQHKLICIKPHWTFPTRPAHAPTDVIVSLCIARVNMPAEPGTATRAGPMASGERHNGQGRREPSDLSSRRLHSQARPRTTPLQFSRARTSLGRALGLLAASSIGLIKCN